MMLQSAFTAFVMVFLAELGDKTQLAVFALSSRANSPWGVFVGAALALSLSALLAAFLGSIVSRLLSESAMRIVHYAAGGFFVLVGAWTIWRA
jgi:putative Ca2+/H+ antiporter (TMEM165/GDT1 family)